MKDSLKNPVITKEEIKTARDFAEQKPHTEAAKKISEFLESEILNKALIE